MIPFVYVVPQPWVFHRDSWVQWPINYACARPWLSSPCAKGRAALAITQGITRGAARWLKSPLADRHWQMLRYMAWFQLGHSRRRVQVRCITHLGTGTLARWLPHGGRQYHIPVWLRELIQYGYFTNTGFLQMTWSKINNRASFYFVMKIPKLWCTKILSLK